MVMVKFGASINDREGKRQTLTGRACKDVLCQRDTTAVLGRILPFVNEKPCC